jgi:protein-L-isoaspartate(D-aspartate) O-methyltransferase
MEEPHHALLRGQMVEEIVAHAHLTAEQTGRDALSERVIEAMGRVPRHEFVPYELKPYAYVNTPLPIGFGKTISQPFINALMTDLLDIRKTDRVLEIGTGMGYQAAILAELAAAVCTVEIIEELAQEARRRLKRLGYDNVEGKVGNGYFGWAEKAPFDRIMCTAAPELIPPNLIAQLKPGGRMMIPAGIAESQQLILVTKGEDGRTRTQEILPVRFSKLMTSDTDDE